MFDIRNDSKAMASVKAHESACCGVSFSAKVPNLLVTSSEDELVKIWDISCCSNEKNAAEGEAAAKAQEPFELVFEKQLKIGPINCSKASPDSGFVFAFGGAESGEPVIWDVREAKNGTIFVLN